MERSTARGRSGRLRTRCCDDRVRGHGGRWRAPAQHGIHRPAVRGSAGSGLPVVRRAVKATEIACSTLDRTIFSHPRGSGNASSVAQYRAEDFSDPPCEMCTSGRPVSGGAFTGDEPMARNHTETQTTLIRRRHFKERVMSRSLSTSHSCPRSWQGHQRLNSARMGWRLLGLAAAVTLCSVPIEAQQVPDTLISSGCNSLVGWESVRPHSTGANFCRE